MCSLNLCKIYSNEEYHSWRTAIYITYLVTFNLLKHNDIYIFRTAALTSRRYILNIYSTNINTEYFKHAA